MNEAIIGLVSAVSVVLLKGIVDYILDRRKRKDKLEDDQSDKDDEILKAIREVKDELRDVRGEVREVRAEAEAGRITECRIRILRFADEISHEVRHSKDHFDQTMDDITKYEKYCEDHPKFPNGITKSSIELIKETFKERMRKNDFL